jgi:hypothetical protein
VEVIEIYASMPESLFGKNDFVGRNIKKITEQFGNTYIKKNDFIVYSDYKNKILMFYAPEDKVVFVKFLRLNKSILQFKDLDKDIFKQKL